MSESAAKIKPFFSPPLHETAVANTLRTTGAEDRALQGCNLSADSGAKTRLELTAKRGSSNLMDWDWHRRVPFTLNSFRHSALARIPFFRRIHVSTLDFCMSLFR